MPGIPSSLLPKISSAVSSLTNSIPVSKPALLKPGVDYRCSANACVGLNAATTAKYIALQQAVNRKLGMKAVLETGIIGPELSTFVARILGRQNFGMTDLLLRPEEFTQLVVNSVFVPAPAVGPGAGLPVEEGGAPKSNGLWWKIGLGGLGAVGLTIFLIKR